MDYPPNHVATRKAAVADSVFLLRFVTGRRLLDSLRIMGLSKVLRKGRRLDLELFCSL